MIFLLFLLYKFYFLKPVFNKEHVSSYVAQQITLYLKETNLCSLSFSLGKNSSGRMFYAEQLNGTKLEYSENFNDPHKFFLDFKMFSRKHIPIGYYTFKINSDFKQNDMIIARFSYANDKNICNFNHDNDMFDKIQVNLSAKAYKANLFNSNLYLISLIILHLILAILIVILINRNTLSLLDNIRFIFFIFSLTFSTIIDYKMNVLFSFVFLLFFLQTQKKIIHGKIILFIYMYTLIDPSIISLYLIAICLLTLDLFRINDLKYHSLTCLVFILSFILGLLFQYPRYIFEKENTTKCSTMNIDFYENKFSYLQETIEKIKEAADKKFSLEKCKFCNFKPISEPTSTERDIIITQIGKNPTLAAYSLFSLRTTGCRAKVIVTLCPNDTINPLFQQDLLDCGIFPVKLDHFYHHKRLEYMKIVRYSLFAEFFEKYGSHFDRSMYFDSFDSVFQFDPFPQKFVNNTLYVSPEFHELEMNFYIKTWMEKIPGVNSAQFNDREVICSGVFTADILTLIKIGQMMKALYRKKTDFITNDQAIFDYLLYSGQFKRAGIEIIRWPYYPSIAIIFDLIQWTELGKLVVEGLTPSIIHHTRRYIELDKNISNACHVYDYY